jgi:hypothetical protein
VHAKHFNFMIHKTFALVFWRLTGLEWVHSIPSQVMLHLRHTGWFLNVVKCELIVRILDVQHLDFKELAS